MPSISICIPTFNRPDCLCELLDSIVSQGVADIEVVITDDASSESTYAAIQGYKDRLPGLRYMRHPNNVGMDRNFLSAIDMATGDYAWLMGDDDRLEKDGLANVLRALDRWPGVPGLTVGVLDYSPDFQQVVGIRGMPPTQRLDSAAEVFGLLAENLGFMSAMIVNRRLWADVCEREPVMEYANFYIQVYIIGKMMDLGGWGVLHTPCVGFRTDNDQLASVHGWLRRLKFDVAAYDEIADGLFPADRRARRAMRKRILRVHIVAHVQRAKVNGASTSSLAQCARVLVKHYADLPALWLRVLPILALPAALVRGLRHLYQRFSPTSGSRRARLARAAGR